MNQDLFAGRYQLLQEAPQGSGGRLFEARDAQTSGIVALKVFRRELEADAPEREDMQRLFDAALACTHPVIVRYHSLMLDDGYLVREWVHGFPVMDILKRRREIPAEELVILLDGVAEALDAAATADLAPTGGVINRLFVGWDRTVSGEDLARLRGTTIHEWSGFEVKLNPLSVSQVLPMAWDETMNTISGDGMSVGVQLNLPVAFAETVYELLGAPHRGSRGQRYVPISTLSEGGNTVLRHIITRVDRPASCTAFWQRLLDASDLHRPPPRARVAPPLPVVAPEAGDAVRKTAIMPAPVAAPPPPPPKRQLEIPAAFVGSAQRGTILRLTPRDVTFAPVHLFARSSFRIGRSLYHADFITRVLPETPENEKLTKELGRVHAMLELRDGKLFIRDGNGEQGSVNGSRFNGSPIHHDPPTPFDRKGVLSLYRHYQLEVTPLLGSYDRGCEIKNEAEWQGSADPAPSISGGVAFRPLQEQVPLRLSAWIFTRLDFSINGRGDITWCDAGTPASQASFLHHRGQFWLANFALPSGSLSATHREILPGQIIPLVPNQPISLGKGNYVVEVQ